MLKHLTDSEAGTVVTPEMIKEAGLAKGVKDGIKILGNGTLEKNLTVQAHKFSKTAIEKIECCRRKGRGDLMEMLRTVVKALEDPRI